MTRKYFCYADETGLDTRGALCVVSVIVSAREREALPEVCETIERATGKGRLKWTDTMPARRLAYMQQVLAHPLLQGCLNFAAYRDSRDYTSMTIQAIARTLENLGEPDYEATIWIDALPRTQERAVGLRLRRAGVHAKKVRGVRKEENDALSRLADALCGFVRAALEGQMPLHAWLQRAIQTNIIHDLSP